jgi:endoglucanase
VTVNCALGQNLNLNKLEYFETQGVNVLVYNNLFNGGLTMRRTPG